MASPADRLRKIKRFDQLTAYLRDELDWPIEVDDFEDAVYDWEPEELGVDSKHAAKIDYVKQLRPLESNQQWGIFFVKFEPKRLPLVVMRRLLNGLVIKTRASAQNSSQAAWKMHDLLFISEYGEGEERKISFAQFHDDSPGNLPVLKVLSWGETQTDLTLDDVDQRLRTKLSWPSDPNDADGWRDQWSAAFTRRHGHVIRTSKDLAAELAGLAKAIYSEAEKILEVETEDGPLTKLFKAFQQALIHDLEPNDFADMYAQTITYGLFSSAVSGTGPDADAEAGERKFVNTERMVQLVPNTNPFLREMLSTFLMAGGEKDGLNFDELGINEVVDVLNDPKTDLPAIIREFGAQKRDEDPVTHFYEDFLIAYNSETRKFRGVYYTPQPVVSYIVRSVHELLKTEFDLEDGLADTTTWGEMVERFSIGNPTRKRGKNTSTKHERVNSEDGREHEADDDAVQPLTIPDGMTADDPFVQILDPATGTATFLVEVIDVIHKTIMAKWKKAGKNDAQCEDAWNQYVPHHLLPRVYGYELMMAPYAIAHMKIGLKLTETGYRFGSEERARVFLTNALARPKPNEQKTLGDWFPALAVESERVAGIKRQVKFSVVIGNPPYANYSANLDEASRRIVDKYRTFRGEKIRERNQLQFERNIQDDFVKFIAKAEDAVMDSGIGVFGFITNATMLASRSLRGMREHLLSTFETIHELHLHGGTNEIFDGAVNDANVFDIEQAVAIHLMTRSRRLGGPSLKFSELIGTRESKYGSLARNTVSELSFRRIEPDDENCNFTGKADSFDETLVSLDDIFIQFGAGIKTNRDAIVIAFTDNELRDQVEAYEATRFDKSSMRMLQYRPFDYRYIYYAHGLVKSRSFPTMKHMEATNNIGLIACSTWTSPHRFSVSVSREMVEMKTGTHDRGTTFFPLLTSIDVLGTESKPVVNLTDAFRYAWQRITGESFETDDDDVCVSAVENFVSWFLGSSYSPAFRERHQVALSQQLPFFPLPKTTVFFADLVRLGAQVKSNLLLDIELDSFDAPEFKGVNRTVSRVAFEDGTVWIDKKSRSGFEGVSAAEWNLYVGGYQPLEKWLKDRQAKGGKNPRPGRTLTTEDIEHYQKMVVAIRETIRLMGEIDEVIDQHGGWPDAFVTEPLDEADA